MTLERITNRYRGKKMNPHIKQALKEIERELYAQGIQIGVTDRGNISYENINEQESFAIAWWSYEHLVEQLKDEKQPLNIHTINLILAHARLKAADLTSDEAIKEQQDFEKTLRDIYTPPTSNDPPGA